MATGTSLDSTEVMAIAFVVESSLYVANEWRQILVDYVGFMMRRLTETFASRMLRIAFVSYGSADTVPSPLPCKRFFTDYPYVVKVMKEDPASLGLGQTNSGALTGMAALEGLVAALELFEALRTSPLIDLIAHSKSAINHIVHIAASPPDDSINPVWNNLPQFDNLTWDVLPEELKKRNIHFNSINLKQHLPRFPELHVSLDGKGSVPWFSVRPTHSIYLSGFPVTPQLKGSSKRTNEIAERGSDAKRPRLSHPTSSPKPNPIPPTANVTLEPSLSAPTHSSYPSSIQNLANILPIKPPIATQQQNRMAERIQVAEIQLLKLKKAIEDARSSGNKERAEAQFQDFLKKREALLRFKQMFNSYNQQGTSSQTRDASSAKSLPPSVNTQQPELDGNPLNLTANSNQSPAVLSLSKQNPITTQTPSSLHASNSFPSGRFKQTPGSDKLISHSIVGQTLNQTSAVPSVLGAMSSLQVNGLPSNTSDVSIQLQKLLEQHRHRPQLQANSGQGESSSVAPSFNAPLPMSQGDPNQPNESLVSAWSGSLKWSGQSATGKKEMQTFVVAMAQSLLMCHADTWPKTLTLVPTREPAVPPADLQTWINLHKPILCPFQPQQHVADAQTNNQHYLSLATLLSNKNIYATAAWTTPSGSQTSNLLVFPFNGGKTLVGAFFPLMGIPEMPRPSTSNPISTLNKHSMNIPHHLLAQLQHLAPDKRNAILFQIRQRQLSAPSGAHIPIFQPEPSFGNNENMPVSSVTQNFVPVAENNAFGIRIPASPRMNVEVFQSFITQNADGGSG